MGITERREREKFERRRAILNCARELILEQGVDQVSMEDIARKAELSKATVYLYFSGKESLFHEICDEAAQIFLERFRPIQESGLTGIAALQYFWRNYVELFGSSDEMLIIFQVRNFLNPGRPFLSLEGDSESVHVTAVLMAIQTLIDQCKAEGVFDAALDSATATRLLLSMFSHSVDNVVRMPPESRKSPAILEELTKVFQVIIYGFAKEGINRSRLDIQMGMEGAGGV